VALRRVLAEARPDAFTPNLADALQNMAEHLAGLHRYDEGLERIAETVTLYATLAEAQPTVFARDLAWALGVRGSILHAADRHPESVEAFHEALATVGEQFHRLPQAFSFVRGQMGGYLSACEAAGVEPDAALIDPMIETLLKHGLIDVPDDSDSPPDASSP
jgi:tetratricopeptide (TPR) repeat protein